MTDHVQLASNQKDIWHDQIAYPESPLYNIGGTLIINGDVNYKILNQALQQLIIENDAFRLTINNQTPASQKVLKKLVFELEFIDFSSHQSPDIKSQAWLYDNFKRPFKFNENNLLWHFALIKESEYRHYLMTKYHHIIADGWSTTVVINRLAEIYNAFLNSQSIETKTSQRYFEFIKKSQEYLYSPAYQEDYKFWKKILPEAPQPLISRRYPVSANAILPKANIYRFKISRHFYQDIINFSSHHKSTSFHILLIALGIYFSRIYQRDEVVIGVPSLNRSGVHYDKVLGMFISLSPLVLRFSQTENIYQILNLCRLSLNKLYRHRRFPISEISKRLKLLQNGRDTLFDILLSYEKHDYSSLIGNATISAKQQFSGVSRYPLAVTICEFNDCDDVEVIFEGAENCFTDEDLKLLAERSLAIVQQMIKQPEKPIEKIDLLTEYDKTILFETFNQEKHKNTSHPTVIQLFKQQVKNHPTKTAIEVKNHKLSFQQLDLVSSQLAQHILNHNINSNNIVAVYLPRGTEMIVGILAILKSAAAYLPIATDIPDERISIILQQSNAKILLTLSRYRKHLSELHNHLICLDDYNLTQEPSVKLLKNVEIKPENLAYVIFTSGSTGQPKGVMIEHSALSSRINWLQSLFKLTPKDRMGQTIHYFFDPSVIEIFLPLTQGACLVPASENDYSVENFAQFVFNKGITSLALVPSSARMLLQGLGARQKTNLRVVCCGGERLEPDLARQFSERTEARLFNVYGLTESTIIATAWEYKTDFDGLTLPIGIPADNTPIIITDKKSNLLPTNVMGEIVITGNTLAKGYIHQPELSQNAFQDSNDYLHLYKTGDVGYIGYDGLLYISGRIDRQVKISGYRIELGEMESVLQRHESVNIAAVTLVETEQPKYLCAYVETNAENKEILVTELYSLLRQQLPSYMQPKTIIPLTSIPTRQTGKVDYASLPSPNFTLLSDNEDISHNLMETQLLQVWKNTLPSTQIEIYDNFFELGGDSISAVSLMIAIEQLTGIRYPLSFLLEHSTISKQAIALNRLLPDTDQLLLTTLSYYNNAIPLYIAASGNGDYLRFSNLAEALGDSCSVHMLQPPETKNNKQSIQSIAQCYADRIMRHSDVPCYISGFSIGGITALETARILVEKGKAPHGIILLDSIYPRWPLQSPLLFKLIKQVVELLNLKKTKINNRRLEVMLSDPGIKAQLFALPEHDIKSAEIPVDLILTKGMWMFHPLFFSTWSRLFRNQLTLHSTHGLHGGIFRTPHLQGLTKIIKSIVTSKKNAETEPDDLTFR